MSNIRGATLIRPAWVRSPSAGTVAQGNDTRRPLTVAPPEQSTARPMRPGFGARLPGPFAVGADAGFAATAGSLESRFDRYSSGSQPLWGCQLSKKG